MRYQKYFFLNLHPEKTRTLLHVCLKNNVTLWSETFIKYIQKCWDELQVLVQYAEPIIARPQNATPIYRYKLFRPQFQTSRRPKVLWSQNSWSFQNRLIFGDSTGFLAKKAWFCSSPTKNKLVILRPFEVVMASNLS